MAYQGESKSSSLCVVCIKILFRNVAFNYNSKIFDSISSSKWADYDIVSAWFVLDPLVQIHLSLNSVVYEKVNYKWIQLVNMSQSQSVINFNWIFSSLARRSSSFSTVIPLFGLSLCRPTNVKSFLFQLLWVWNGGKGNVEEARNNWGFNSLHQVRITRKIIQRKKVINRHDFHIFISTKKIIHWLSSTKYQQCSIVLFKLFCCYFPCHYNILPRGSSKILIPHWLVIWKAVYNEFLSWDEIKYVNKWIHLTYRLTTQLFSWKI